MQGLVSSVPGVYAALLKLAQEAGGEQEEPVMVFPFELAEYEPASYVLISGIKGPRYEWESIGDFAQKELYEIHGKATVFSGDDVGNNPGLAIDVMTETFALFQTCVMTPVMSNRDMPILGTTGPTPYLILPEDTEYTAGPGTMAGGSAGWSGELEWSFHFEAILTPA